MYQTSEEFNEKVKSTGRTSRAKLKIGDTEITSDIRRISHVSGSCGPDSFSIGSVFSAYADIELQKTGIEIQGKTVEIYFGLLLDDGTVEYAKKGTFVAEKPEGDTQTITFHAQDNIARKCNGSYVSTLTFPTTIKAVLDDIASQTGITYRLNGLDASGQITVKPEGYVCVDVLGYMAGCMGGFVYCDADGVVVLSSFDVSGTANVTPNLCWTEPTIGENQYTVGGLTVVVSESTESEQTVTKTDENGETYEDTEYITVEGVKFTYGSGGIAVSNPFMTQELFDAIKEKVVAISFRPGTVEFFGDARLDPTDAVQVTTLAGETFTIPCMNIVQEFDGGLTTTVSAPSDKNSDGIEITGPIGKAIKKIEADIIIAKEMTLNRLTVEDLRTRKLTATNLHITGESTFDGVLNGATGSFSGNVSASSLTVRDVVKDMIGNNIVSAIETTIETIAVDEFSERYIRHSIGLIPEDNEGVSGASIVACNISSDAGSGRSTYEMQLVSDGNIDMFSGGQISLQAIVGGISLAGDTNLDGSLTTSGDIYVSGEATFNSSINASRYIYSKGFVVNGLGNTKFDSAQIRGAGTSNKELSIVTYSGFSSVTFFTLIDANNAFIPKATNLDGSMRQTIGSSGTSGAGISHMSTNSSGQLNINAQWGSTSSRSTRYVATTSSDVRLKHNIKPTELCGLEVINQIQLKQFDWIDSGIHQEIGFIADELELIDPHLAVGGGYDEDGCMNVKGVDEFYLVGCVVKSIQELCEKNKELCEEIAILKKQLQASA